MLLVRSISLKVKATTLPNILKSVPRSIVVQKSGDPVNIKPCCPTLATQIKTITWQLPATQTEASLPTDCFSGLQCWSNLTVHISSYFCSRYEWDSMTFWDTHAWPRLRRLYRLETDCSGETGTQCGALANVWHIWYVQFTPRAPWCIVTSHKVSGFGWDSRGQKRWK